MLGFIHSFHNSVPSWLLLALLVLLIITVLAVAQFNLPGLKRIRIVSLFILLEYLFLIFCVTVFFREVNHDNYGVDLVPFGKYQKFFDCTGEIGREIITNILMFIPVGFLASIVCPKRKFTFQLSFAFVVSSLVELSQWLNKCGWCEVNDLIHNVIGSILGYLIYKLFKYLSYKLFSR